MAAFVRRARCDLARADERLEELAARRRLLRARCFGRWRKGAGHRPCHACPRCFADDDALHVERRRRVRLRRVAETVEARLDARVARGTWLALLGTRHGLLEDGRAIRRGGLVSELARERPRELDGIVAEDAHVARVLAPRGDRAEERELAAERRRRVVLERRREKKIVERIAELPCSERRRRARRGAEEPRAEARDRCEGFRKTPERVFDRARVERRAPLVIARVVGRCAGDDGALDERDERGIDRRRKRLGGGGSRARCAVEDSFDRLRSIACGGVAIGGRLLEEATDDGADLRVAAFRRDDLGQIRRRLRHVLLGERADGRRFERR